MEENRRVIQHIKNEANRLFDAEGRASGKSLDSLFNSLLSSLEKTGRQWTYNDVLLALSEIENIHIRLLPEESAQRANTSTYEVFNLFIAHMQKHER